MDRDLKTNAASSRSKAVLIRTPDILVTPTMDTTGRVSSVQFDLERPTSDGIIGGFWEFDRNKDTILNIDFSGVDKEDASARVEKMTRDALAGNFGNQRDIRDVIDSGGDPASETSEDKGRRVAKEAAAAIVAIIKPTVDKAVNDGKPPKAPEKNPVRDDTGGGALTPAQIVRVSIALSKYTPPEIDHREPKGENGTSTLKGVPTDPAIGKGQEKPSKNLRITARIVPNSGYTDPTRDRMFDL